VGRDQREHCRLVERHRPQAVGVTRQELSPVQVGGHVHVGAVQQVVDDPVHHGVDERLVVRHVPVQGHRLDSELAPKPPHAQRRNTIAFDQR